MTGFDLDELRYSSSFSGTYSFHPSVFAEYLNSQSVYFCQILQFVELKDFSRFFSYNY